MKNGDLGRSASVTNHVRSTNERASKRGASNHESPKVTEPRAAITQGDRLTAESRDEIEQLVDVLKAVEQGDFRVRVGIPKDGILNRAGELLSDVLGMNEHMTGERLRVGKVVGQEGRMHERASVGLTKGAWAEGCRRSTSSSPISWHRPTIAKVTTAVAKGDLSQKITVDARGEILELKTTIHVMVDQLSSFAAEVTRIAKEVGNEGKLGGQTEVRGVSGTWKDLTDNDRDPAHVRRPGDHRRARGGHRRQAGWAARRLRRHPHRLSAGQRRHAWCFHSALKYVSSVRTGPEQKGHVAPMPIHLSIAGRSDLGRCRENNEDALVIADIAGGHLLRGDSPSGRFDVGERGVLLAVSDGMGGESAGEVASAVVVEALARAMVGAPPELTADAQIEGAVQSANREVLKAAQQNGREGMGATLTAVFVQAGETGATAYIAEVGDSRAYLLRAGRIARLTKDQSYVQLLVDTGALDAAQAAESPLHNVILQAMGHHGTIDVALGKLELRGRDCLLLCSDGLSNALEDAELLDAVIRAPSLDQACADLVDLANGRGGKDNVTVLLAGVGGDLAPASVGAEAMEPPVEVLQTYEPKARSSRRGRDLPTRVDAEHDEQGDRGPRLS